MSNDLDPQLLRLFATASEPLSEDEFRARVMAHIEEQHGWRAITQAAGSTLRAIGAGLALGVAAPFRPRMSFGKLVAIGLGAIASCLALLAT